MKKLFVASFLSLGLSISAFGAGLVVDKSPVDQKGGIAQPAYAGASSCMITASTGTSAVLCDTGEGIILGVYGSSVAATDQIVFRDTATANTSSTKLLIADLTALSKPAQMFPRYKNGLSANVSVAPAAAGTATPAWTVIYKALD
jgi:hypothetical protein